MHVNMYYRFRGYSHATLSSRMDIGPKAGPCCWARAIHCIVTRSMLRSTVESAVFPKKVVDSLCSSQSIEPRSVFVYIVMIAVCVCRVCSSLCCAWVLKVLRSLSNLWLSLYAVVSLVRFHGVHGCVCSRVISRYGGSWRRCGQG